MYNRWFEYDIIRRLESINDPILRIKFLFSEKSNFISLNSGRDADQIIKRFDNLIEQEKTLATYAKTFQVTYNNKIDRLIRILITSCIEILAHPELYHILKKHFKDQSDKQRENHRTGHIIYKSNDKNTEFKIENQHLTGQSATKNSTGTVDFAVFFDKEKISIGEALNSSAQNTNRINQNIDRHLKKLIRNYNYSALSDLIFLVYYDGASDKFHSSFDNYRKHFEKWTELVVKPTKAINNITSDFVTNSASIKLAKSTHSYSGDTQNEFSIYHFYIDFSEK